MAVRTHESKWRLFVSVAPLLGVVFVVCAAVQGESDVARSTAVRGVLAAVAAIGALVAAWTAYQRRAAPPLLVAQASVLALAGQLADVVALSGLARALPGAAPLIAPSGELCLWFGHAEQRVQRHGAQPSTLPFLLVDASGRCIVLPAGADVTGGVACGEAAPAAAPTRRARPGAPSAALSGERLLRDGDAIRVVGRFVPRSAEAMSLQEKAATIAAGAAGAMRTVRATEPDAFRRALAAALSAPPGAAAAAPSPLALPVIAAPRIAAPFLIRIGKDESDEELFGLLALVDAGVMLLSGGLFAWTALL